MNLPKISNTEYIEEVVFHNIWTPLGRAIGDRWTLPYYPVINLARSAMDRNDSDNDIVILASQVLRE